MPQEQVLNGVDNKQLLAALTALKRGDHAVRLPVEWTGIAGKIADTFNDAVEQMQASTEELLQISRLVGKEGKLSQRLKLANGSGAWASRTEAINTLIGDLVHPTSEMSRVIGAVAKGDLSQKMAVESNGQPLEGEFLRTAKTVNTMVEQLGSFASEVTRVAREVSTEGKLGGQAQVKGGAGTWKDLTDNVNLMASNLTSQVRNIATVTTAVANGDLTKKITVDVRGEFLELKDTINTMVDQLRSFASEVTRVAREVGTEGKLGGQARVEGVSGTWKDLTDNVNSMASNLTGQVRNIAAVTTAVAKGDLSKKITVDARGEILELKNTVNTMVDQLSSFASEVTRVAREVGTEGILGGQAEVSGVAGTWKDLTDSVNSMAGNLTGQVRNIAEVTTAVARGDLSKKITVDVRGEILELKDTINTMVDQLSSFASEVTRVAREVGTEGKLGGQADVKGVSGTWKDLTDNVNFMAGNLTNQVRGIAKVVTAVANGDLNRKLLVEAKGEIAELADTINSMIDTLATFADQVTTVAREVGVEGKLGGQASVPGAAGTWKGLTENVNQLAANLTTQVRAIAEVATAVTKGDLTRSIKVEASGEVAALKDNINEMIGNLKDTTLKNSEQDWLKTNLAKFSRMLQGQKDLLAVGKLILSELAPTVAAQHGVFYTMENDQEQPQLRLLASYAYKERKSLANRFKLGEGLVGQSAFEKQRILLTDVPGNYVQIQSGLGEAAPLNIIVLPVVFEGDVKAVIELASFNRFSPTHQTFLEQLTESIGIVLNTIEANMRTEGLLQQSQSLARELQSQQEELQQTNEELEEKARLLADQNVEVERKNREVEQARVALEEKASQLALTSRYKSEFLANMSHELRTPLNSLLILAQQLAGNTDGNLSGKQVEFAKTIHGAGTELLRLINDILDLAKIESGTVMVDVGEIALDELKGYVERTFGPVAEAKALELEIQLQEGLPASIRTDAKRLQQVLRNLLANAIKFTERGQIALRVKTATSGWAPYNEALDKASSVIAFQVSDTGIGIHPDQQRIIFEAFQQADGSTSRKYGGTGLGLAISREIARLLGGDISLTSAAGRGSTFTLYLPESYPAPKAARADSARTSQETRPRVALADRATASKPVATQAVVDDDRDEIAPRDRVLLIVEDDPGFAAFVRDLARTKGFKSLHASRGTEGLALAHEYRPDAMVLDLSLPDIDGWSVLESLKNNPATRHIPVQIISALDDEARGLSQGALAFLPKPVEKAALDAALNGVKEFIDRRVKSLLIVEDDPVQRQSIVDLIGNGDVQTTTAATGREGLNALKQQHFDCVVLDLGLPDISGFEFLDQVKQAGLRNLPIIVYTAKELPKAEETELKRMAQTIVLKDVRSPERLLDETALFLHRVADKLPEPKRRMLQKLRESDEVLSDKKVLVVEDDIRNIFAITSLLERHGMEVISAETGKDALEALRRTPEIDLVLMDIMLPGMDGYETMKTIRSNWSRSMPIIALTAKAMKGDREKCLEAGASDYIAKPIDSDRLLSLLRVWLYR